MGITPEQARQWERRGLIKPGLIHSTQTESSKPQTKSPQPCVPWLSGTCLGDENKTEREFRLLLEAKGWKHISRHPLKIRIGPPEKRCSYEVDYGAVDQETNRFCVFEVKGGFEREDARVKRMAAAVICKTWGLTFIYAQKKNGQWTIEELT